MTECRSLFLRNLEALSPYSGEGTSTAYLPESSGHLRTPPWQPVNYKPELSSDLLQIRLFVHLLRWVCSPIEMVYAVNGRLVINYCSVAFFVLQMTVVLCGFLSHLCAEMCLYKHSIKKKRNTLKKKRSPKYKI